MEDWSKGNDLSLFIQKLNRNGETVEGAVVPEELLIDYYRGRSKLDTIVDTVAASAVRITEDDNWGKAVVATAKKFGAYKHKEAFFAFKELPFAEEEQTQIHFDLKLQAVKKLQEVSKNGKPELQVLITGGTGFIGMDMLASLAPDPTVKKVYCIVWHRELGGSSPAQFKERLMSIIGVTDPSQAEKFEVLPGDVTQENMGMTAEDLNRVQSKITHLVHLAASVSFEDPYDMMFKANVTATQVVLKFASQLQNLPNSSFVNFISTETCYIHGRSLETCREDRLQFPRDYYNNHYELTKALGDLYCRHFTLEKKLRVISLCPAITVGKYTTGNNRADTKVINAAANAFGLISTELAKQHWLVRGAVSRILSFPGLNEAKLNLIAVDRITAGLHSALTKPLATGERVHLGGDGIKIKQFAAVFQEEIGLKIRLVNPTIHRLFWRPLMRVMCNMAGMQKIFSKLEGLFNIFASYAEWGQPVHELGNDVKLLGLPVPRPNIVYLAHMLCRHNQMVQGWGKIRDKVVINERERKWEEFINDLERRHEIHPGAMSAKKFQEEAAKLQL